MSDVAITIKVLDPLGEKEVSVSDNDQDVVDIFFHKEGDNQIHLTYSNFSVEISSLFNGENSNLRWVSAFEADSTNSEEDWLEEYDEGANWVLPPMKAEDALHLFLKIRIGLQTKGLLLLASTDSAMSTPVSQVSTFNFSEFLSLMHSLCVIEGIVKTAKAFDHKVQITANFY